MKIVFYYKCRMCGAEFDDKEVLWAQSTGLASGLVAQAFDPRGRMAFAQYLPPVTQHGCNKGARLPDVGVADLVGFRSFDE